MYIKRREAGTVEGCRHLHLPVDPLLTQDRNTWTHTFIDEWCCNIVIDVERQIGVQPRIAGITDRFEFFISALGIIAQPLHTVAGLVPDTLQIDACLIEQTLTMT